MKTTLLYCLILLSFLGCKSKPDTIPYPKLWVGKVTWKQESATVYLNFEKLWFGKLDSYAYNPGNAEGIKSSECRIVGDSLFIQFTEKVNAKYAAKIGKEEITGWWEQNGMRLLLTLRKSGMTRYQMIAADAVNYAKKESLNREKVDWDKINRRVMELSEKAESEEELLPALHFILESLEDKHGMVLLDGKSSGYSRVEDSRGSTELKRARSKYNKGVVSEMLDDSVAYLRVPTSPDGGLEKDETYNIELQKQVCDLINKGAKNWIIDVRLNNGGNMYLMLSGLNQLLGEGKAGSIVDLKGTELEVWEMKGGNAYMSSKQETKSGMVCPGLTNAGKIAVLTGPFTSSSGEILAIALRLKDNCLVFGETSKGFTTSTQGILVSEDLFFFCSTSFYSDGKGKIYRNGIDPDFRIDGGDNLSDLRSDAKVKAAMKWINEGR
jgi:carboxyl-terminal processing protease